MKPLGQHATLLGADASGDSWSESHAFLMSEYLPRGMVTVVGLGATATNDAARTSCPSLVPIQTPSTEILGIHVSKALAIYAPDRPASHMFLMPNSTILWPGQANRRVA